MREIDESNYFWKCELTNDTFNLFTFEGMEREMGLGNCLAHMRYIFEDQIYILMKTLPNYTFRSYFRSIFRIRDFFPSLFEILSPKCLTLM